MERGRAVVRVGIPSFLSERLLGGFPPEAEIVRMSPEETGPIEVEFLLAPWGHTEAAQVLKRVRGARVVQSFGAGIEGLLPILPEGAMLCNAQGLHDVPTAEWAVTAILASLKFLPLYAGLQAEGRWVTREDAAEYYAPLRSGGGESPDVGPELKRDAPAEVGAKVRADLPILVDELHGKTVLIVGYGSIGKAIEDRLRAFGPKIVRVARSAREGVWPVSELPELLSAADVVVLITPLTPETYQLMDAAAIGRMKQGALLVNAARGGVVATDALVAALYERRIRAALDVTDPEPLPAGHPLWRAPGLLLTPHVAGSSPAFLERVVGFAREQLERYLRGEPLENVIRGAY